MSQSMSPPGPALTPEGLHDQAKGHYEALQKQYSFQQKIETELEKLLAKGDNVLPEDVIDGAAELVGHGADAKAMAGLLADMPQSGGEALSGWLESHAAQVQNSLMQTKQMMELARHQMGTSALRMLGMLNSGAEGPGAPPGNPLGPQSGPPANALTPSGGS